MPRLQSPVKKISPLSFHKFLCRAIPMKTTRVDNYLFGLRIYKTGEPSRVIYTNCGKIFSRIDKRGDYSLNWQANHILYEWPVFSKALQKLGLITKEEGVEHHNALKEERRKIDIECQKRDFYNYIRDWDGKLKEFLVEDVENFHINLTSENHILRKRAKALVTFMNLLERCRDE